MTKRELLAFAKHQMSVLADNSATDAAQLQAGINATIALGIVGDDTDKLVAIAASLHGTALSLVSSYLSMAAEMIEHVKHGGTIEVKGPSDD
jgi:hypothetical protein